MSQTDPEHDSGTNGPDPIPLEPDLPPERRPGKARIESPGLMEDFDEDADFESDPEVERVVKGIPVREEPRDDATPSVTETSPEGVLAPWSSWKAFAAIGGVVTVTAAVFAGVYADHHIWAYVLLVPYRAALHTGTGVGALVITAILLGRSVGRFDAAAARMFMAVSFFLITYSLEIPLTDGKLEEVVLGAAAYFGGLIAGFRMAPRDAVVVGAAHFGIVLIVTLGNMLSGVIAGGAVS